jgi:hypothetical protein
VKKLIFYLFVILLAALLASCGLNPAPAENDASRSDDGDSGRRRELPRTVTLRLADYGEYEDDTIGIGMGNIVAGATNRQSESRALSLPNAQAAHDIFEVVFYYPGNQTVARAVWGIGGETPELRGVHRTGSKNTPLSGVNYGYVNVNSEVTNRGYAMVFVGAKSDKTLLAVGRLTEVDGAAGTEIFADTKSVTFAVTALKAGTSLTAANSSFKTSYGADAGSNNPNNVTTGNTQTMDVPIHYVGNKRFPLFLVNRPTGAGVENPGTNGTTIGKYEFEVDSIVVAGGVTYDFNEYSKGFVLAGVRNCEVRNPRYIITEGLYQYSSIFKPDLRTGLAVMNNNLLNVAPAPTANVVSYFQNPVQFTFVTTNSPDGSIFALVFEIFVHNLTQRPTSPASVVSDDNAGPVKWRISPGDGTYWLDLDNGLLGNGGAILLGSGNIAAWLAPYLP